jgi:hypothetical protein
MVGVLTALLTVVALLAVLSLIQRREALVSGAFVAISLILLAVIAWMTAATLGRMDRGPIGNQAAPVGAVLVFDTSPRMQYLRENRSRLDEAQEISLWLVKQLPAASEVAVVDSRPGSVVFAVDLAAAQRSIERLESTTVPLPMTTMLHTAVQLAQTSAKSRKEVYLFTDLSRAAWKRDAPGTLQQALADAPGVLLYVVDVGADEHRNISLGELELSAQVLPQSGQLQLRSQVRTVGLRGDHAVEVHLETPDPERPVIVDGRTLLPEPQLRDQQIVSVTQDGVQGLDFTLGNLPLGVHQGTVRLAGQDGLALDNVRHFTVEVQEASPVLVLAPPGVTTKYLSESISPYEFRETGRARYACTIQRQAAVPNIALEDYAVVCLLDPAPMTPPDWSRIADYVRGGGSLAMFLGHNANPSSFNDPAAYPLLGGKLTRQWRSAGDAFLAPRDYSHRVTAAFREMATSVPWDRFPVYRHWAMDDFAPTARLVIPYNNNKPALIETTLGQGRVLTMTTPVSDPLQLEGRQPWNELPTGPDAWPFVVLVNEMMEFLVDRAGTKLNYVTGETAVLPNSPDRYPDRYQLFTPLDQPQDVTAADGRLVVKFTEFPGAYRLKGNRGGTVIRGFCANLPASASELSRLERSELDAILGSERYHFARSIDEIVLGVGEARMGREFYAALLLLAAVILAMELLLANRFYRNDPVQA